jgi:hypothetical protein
MSLSKGLRSTGERVNLHENYRKIRRRLFKKSFFTATPLKGA